MRAAMKFWSYS